MPRRVKNQAGRNLLLAGGAGVLAILLGRKAFAKPKPRVFNTPTGCNPAPFVWRLDDVVEAIDRRIGQGMTDPDEIARQVATELYGTHPTGGAVVYPPEGTSKAGVTCIWANVVTVVVEITSDPTFEPSEPPGAGPVPQGVPSYVGYDRAMAGKHNRDPDPNEFYQWPHGDVFPTEQSFSVMLTVLGYMTTNPDPISGVMMRRVKAFQRDYNEVRRSWLQSQGQPVTGLIVTDGLIGKATIDALIYADNRQKQQGPWTGIVAQAYDERGAEWPGPTAPL